MKMKNLLFAAITVCLLGNIINTANAATYDVIEKEYKSSINETIINSTIKNYVENKGTINSIDLTALNNEIMLDYNGFINNIGRIYNLTLNLENNNITANGTYNNLINNEGTIDKIILTMANNSFPDKSYLIYNPNGTIKKIELNLTGNIFGEDSELITSTNKGSISSIKGTVSNNTLYSLIGAPAETSVGTIDLVMDNNIVNDILISNGLSTIENVYGTYTNNKGNGFLLGNSLGGVNNTDIVFENNEIGIFRGVIGALQKIDATALNNNQKNDYGLFSNYVSYISQLSGTYENNTGIGEHGIAIKNIGGVIGITTQNKTDTIFTNNTNENGTGSGIYNLFGTAIFNTDKYAKIIINDSISGDKEAFKNMSFVNKEDVEETIDTLDELKNVIYINPSNVEDLAKAENADYEYEDLAKTLNISKTNGTIEFNNLVSNQDIYIFNGNLKLGSWVDNKGTKHYGNFNDVNLYLEGGTLNTIDNEIRNINVVNLTSTNGKLSIDMDFTKPTAIADTLTAELVNGTFDFNNINFIGTPANKSGIIQIIAGNIGEEGISFKDFTTFDSDFNTYTFTDAGNGYLKYDYSKGDGEITLKMAIDFTNGDRSYNMKKTETIKENLGSMAGDGSTLTVNGNNHLIDGQGYNGLTVNPGQTLIINNVVVKNFNEDSEYNGSFITNLGFIENLDGTFIDNTSKLYGVIANTGKINIIDGDFKNNASGVVGVIGNENGTINKISGTFDNNKASNEVISSGVIGNSNGQINEINGTFTNNKANGELSSGVIINTENSTIDIIKGTFANNSATGEGANAGAILNDSSTINKISGTFTNNNSIYGGAITNICLKDYAIIKSIEGKFENNTGVIGGAITNVGIGLNIVADTMNTSFTGNKNSSGSNAIINEGIVLNLNAREGKTITFNDAIGYNFEDYVAIFNNLGDQIENTEEERKEFYEDYDARENIININSKKDDLNTYKAFLAMDGLTEEEMNNLSKEQMEDYIKIVDEEILNILELPDYNTGTIEINNTIKNSMVNMLNGTLKFGTNTQGEDKYIGGLDEHSILNIFGGKISLQNNGINNANLGNLALYSEMNLSLDADLAKEKMDTISANSFTSNGNSINITNINLLSATNKKSLSLSPLSENMDSAVRQSLAESIIYSGGDVAYGNIYKYTVAYDKDNAVLNFGLKSSGNTLSDFNPAVAAKPIIQSGTQSVQLDSYTEAFRNMDMFMLMPENERLAYKYRNKYASLESDLVYDPTMSTYQNNTGWFRPYTTFENVPLKNGPKVSNTSYGTYFGYDTSLLELGKGWDGTFGIYAGYNGSHQTFKGNSIYQNGGTLGLIGVAYKGNFFSGWTLNVGASSGSTTNMYGSDNFTSLMGGISTKNGYNFEFADGKVILQPSLLLSYGMVNTFDYTNASGVRLKSDPLHTIQIEPSIKLIGNIGTWQPYANVAMVWNILNETKVTANDVVLPEVSVKPYVKYGVGLQKKWADKFTAFGQCYVTNGGRNGVGLQAGLRIALGDETTKSKAAWLNPKKKDTTIVLDGKVK